jgi:hypothetical protein
MATSMQKYTFDAPAYEMSSGATGGKKKGKHHHRRQLSSSNNSENGNDHDPTDGSGSLTYSAASSINSTAGESTDSSFADIMRVLDVQDSKELAAVLHKERARHSNSHFGSATSKHSQISRHPYHHGDERSIAAHSIAAESLTYSTDAESHMRSLDMRSLATDGEFSGLHGTGILATIAGYVSLRWMCVVVFSFCTSFFRTLTPIICVPQTCTLASSLCHVDAVVVCTYSTVNQVINMPMTAVLVAMHPRHLLLPSWVENGKITMNKVEKVLVRLRIAAESMI